MSLGLSGGTQSQSSNMAQNILSSGSTTGSSTQESSPYQQALQSPLFSTIKSLMTNPMQTVAPLIQQAKNSITSSYSGAADALRQKFMSTGGGKSGKYGTGVLQSQIGQQGDLAGADVQGAASAAQLPLSAASLGTNLLGLNEGQSYAGASSGNQNTTGTSDQSGSYFGAKGGFGYTS